MDVDAISIIQNLFRFLDSQEPVLIFYCLTCFLEYIEYFKEVLDNSNVMTFEGFFQYIMLPRLKDKEKGARYFRLWNDTINDLEPQVKELVLYNIKLDLERRMERQVEFYKNYEEVRFAIRDKPHMIAIEGHCKQCNHFITFPFSLQMYNKRMTYAHIIPLVIKCHNCQKKDSLSLPYLI
jgi:hypothetical protein